MPRLRILFTAVLAAGLAAVPPAARAQGTTPVPVPTPGTTPVPVPDAGPTPVPAPGPGTTPAPAPTPNDADGDGLADSWETKYGLNPNSAAGDDGASGDPDGDGVTNAQEAGLATDPTLANVLSFPEGATGFFRELLAVANPGVDPAQFTVTFLREGGAPPVTQTYTLAARRRLTIEVNQIAELSNTPVSATIRVSQGGVVAERRMMWDGRDGSLYGGHLGKAVTRARTTWYLAEGEASFFDTYILLANSGDTSAAVTLSFLLTDGSTITRQYTVGANARVTVYANDVPGVRGRAFSTVVTSTVPISVERAMYFGTTAARLWNGGHAAAAVESPATSWFVAEGRTGPFFDMYLLIANPGTTAAAAAVRYLKPGGGVVTQTVPLAPTSRTTIHVDSLPGLENTDVSASITADQPVIVERAMYWPDPVVNWYEAHASAGVTATGTRWALADGEIGGSLEFETYVLLANPSATDANVTLTFLRAAEAPTVLTRTVPANGRLTVSAASAGLAASEQFGVLAVSGNGVPIVVEHAIYWNGGGQFWGGGVNETAVKIR